MLGRPDAARPRGRLGVHLVLAHGAHDHLAHRDQLAHRYGRDVGLIGHVGLGRAQHVGAPLGTPGVSSGSASASSHAQPQVSTVTETVTASANSTNVPPAAAPVTGGGGTAGFQGTLLLVLGAAAIVAGAGGLVYRRWLGRGR